MFTRRRRLGLLEQDVAWLKCELVEARRRIDIMEAGRDKRGEDKSEQLYMEGLSNVMNYSLEAIRKAGEKVGG